MTALCGHWLCSLALVASCPTGHKTRRGFEYKRSSFPLLLGSHAPLQVEEAETLPLGPPKSDVESWCRRMAGVGALALVAIVRLGTTSGRRPSMLCVRWGFRDIEVVERHPELP